MASTDQNCPQVYGIRSLRSSVFDIKQMIWLDFVQNVQMYRLYFIFFLLD